MEKCTECKKYNQKFKVCELTAGLWVKVNEDCICRHYENMYKIEDQSEI